MVLLTVAVLSGCAGMPNSGQRVYMDGAVIGGVVGGAIGSQIGQGNGRTVATVVGVAVGANIGSRLSGGQQQGYNPGSAAASRGAAEYAAVQESRQRCADYYAAGGQQRQCPYGYGHNNGRYFGQYGSVLSSGNGY